MEERMVLARILIGFLAFALVLIATYALSTRRQKQRAQRNPRELVISSMSGLALGAMFAGFQAILQPETRHRIVEEQREESFQDQSGIEPEGGWLLVQQLQQIRKGTEVEQLIVRASTCREIEMDQDSDRKS